MEIVNKQKRVPNKVIGIENQDFAARNKRYHETVLKLEIQNAHKNKRAGIAFKRKI